MKSHSWHHHQSVKQHQHQQQHLQQPPTCPAAAAAMSDSDSDSEQLNPLQQRDEDWEDWAGDGSGCEGDEDATCSLFDPSTLLPSPEAALDHDASQHSFDLRQYRTQLGLDDYGTIRVINFIRTEVAAGRDPRPALSAAAAAGSSSAANEAAAAAAPWSGDTYLQPVLADDPLLTYDFDDEQQQQQDGLAAAMGGLSAPSAAAAGDASADASATIAALRSQLAAAQSEKQQLLLRLGALMEVALPPELREVAAEEDGAGSSSMGAAAASSSSTGGGGFAAGSTRGFEAASGPVFKGVVKGGAAAAGGVGSAGCRVDAAYFDSYSYFDIHQEMLSDKPRTLAYQAALTHNPNLMRGATVLDVGCGTSILSLFAAQGGAASVVGLDGSARIAGFARQIVAANGLDVSGGGPVSIIAGKVEEVEGIGHDKVSVIVSEWMGYALLFESMLGSLLAARDRWLAPGGAVLPDRASIWVAGADERAFGTAFWQEVYGFSMSPVASELSRSAVAEAKVLVRPVEAEALVTDSQQVHDMDLATMTADQQDFTATFQLTAAAAAAAAAGSSSGGSSDVSVTMAALVLWFDVEFSKRFCRDHPVTLSTSPSAEVTHWAHAVLPLATPVSLLPGASVMCRLSMARSRSKHRCLDISLEVGQQARVYSMEVTGTD